METLISTINTNEIVEYSTHALLPKQKLLSPGNLLDDKGNLSEAGYSTQLIKTYRRSDIKAGSLRIKEWDYYYVGNDEFGLALTIADNSYMSLASVSFLMFKGNVGETTKTIMGFMPRGSLKLPSSSKSGVTYFEKKNKGFIKFTANPNEKSGHSSRNIECLLRNFKNGEKISCSIKLEETLNDSLVIATPFEKPKHFYYNQKINLMKATGTVKIGNTNYTFDEKNNSWGVLDWGRGVWTYKNTWYWSSMSSLYKGIKIGFNLGYGFGDVSQASENIFYYGNRSYKLGRVVFDIPKLGKNKDDFVGTWIIKSPDKRIDITFKPILNRHSGTNVILIKSIQNQVFGIFSGHIMIDNNEKITFDCVTGFAEKVFNCW